MNTTYLIFDKQKYNSYIKDSAFEVGAFLWGKTIAHYTIVKFDDKGERLVKLETCNIKEIIDICEEI